MAAKDTPVVDLIEEEEEEWPEAGVQNVEEAERYVEKINNVFDHLSTLIHEDTKTALGQTIKKFQKDSCEAVGNDGGCQCRCHPLNHKRPHCSVFVATPAKRGS